MRIIFLILCFWMPSIGISQDDKPPTQKEIAAQKQEAIKDIKQQIADLKKEIAEAKENKENPESIQEMEKQLATLEQMLGILGKNFYSGKPDISNPDLPKKIEPKYISPIVPIVLKQQVLPPSEDQAKDELLWYKGKKINDTTIVTTQNTVVQYNRKRHMIIVQVDKKKDTTSLKIAANLGKCRQWTTQYVDNLASTKNIFFEYPEIIMHLKEFDFLEETYREILKNTVDLPIPEKTIASVSVEEATTTGPSPVEDYTSGADDFLKQLHKNMMDQMFNAPSETFPGSPGRRLWDICTTCNEQEFEAFKKAMKNWQNDFIKYESGLLEKMSAVRVWMAKEGITYATSEIPTLEHDLKRAVDFAFERWDRKLDYLESYYGQLGPGEMDVVIENILLIQNQKKIYYGNVDERYTFRLKNLLLDYEKRITDRYEQDMKYKSYVSVLNTRLIQAYDRHYKLIFGSSTLGGSNVSSPLKNLLDKIKKFNRFSLSIDLDFEVELKKDAHRKVIQADGQLSNTDKVYVSLGKAKDCKWQLYLTNTDYTDLSQANEIRFRIPMTVKGGTKYTYFEPRGVEMASYSGPADMLLAFPYTSIDFCQNRGNLTGTHVPDTIILESLRYRQEDLSRYKPEPKQYSVDLLQYADKMFLSVEQTAEVYTDLLMTANEMMTVALMGRVDKPTGFPKLDPVQIEFKKNGEQRTQQRLLASKTHFGNTIILCTPGSQDFINVTRQLTNTELFGGYNLNKGNITLKIVHEPQ